MEYHISIESYFYGIFSMLLSLLKPSWFVCEFLCHGIGMFVGKIEKDAFGFATFMLKLFKTGFGLSVSGYLKCILNVYILLFLLFLAVFTMLLL
jgi:hypothetical protein